MAQPLKSSLRAPEGKWTVSSERRPSTNFSPDLVVQLTYAEVPNGEGSPALELLIFNIQNFLYVCHPQTLDREPLRVIDLRQATGGGALAYPTCHAHTPASRDDFDLAVGLSTGEVVLLSLRAQLKAPASNTRPVTSMSLNVEGSAGSAARCVALAWLPGSDGGAFVAAHRDGTVLVYHKVVGSSSDTKLLARSGSGASLRPPVVQLQGPGVGGGAAALAVAPDGRHVAVACRDGVLRLYAHPGGGVVGGFKSYYGGLTCCCWSPDGRYVAAGGEDDLLCVYGLRERCCVAVCRGHASWVAAVAFDPWLCDSSDNEQQQQQASEQRQQQQQQQQPALALGPSGGGRVYRLASVGQDCQLALWDIVVTEEAVAAAQQASSANNSPDRERPGLPPSPSKRRSSSRSSSPVKRHGSGIAAFRQRSGLGGGAADPGALPVALPTGTIAPPLPRTDWPLVTPVAQGRVHPEPACSLAFTPDALLTACHGACVRRWGRPPLTQQAVMQRKDSLQSLAKAGAPL